APRAARAAPGTALVDVGLRRAQRAEAALLSARASSVAGCAGTATLLAGLRAGSPPSGTRAQSYVQGHHDAAHAIEP
ncbi:nicotinate phosphoribosyltransferase, partial [Burkholderia pseudomallei]